MAISPEAGWYTDPGDGTRHRYWDGAAWTDQTRSGDGATAPRRSTRRPWLWAGISAGILVLTATVWLFVSADWSSQGDFGANPTPTATDHGSQALPIPQPSSTTSASDVVVPEGWGLFTSPTGVLSCAIDTEWLDVLAPSDQDQIHEAYSYYPDLTSEFSAYWNLGGLLSVEGPWVEVWSVSDGTTTRGLRGQATSYADSGGDNYSPVADEEFLSDHGYSGWRIDYTMTYDDVLHFETIIVIGAGETLVVLYGSSTIGFDTYLDGMLGVARSLVVHHPPAEG